MAYFKEVNGVQVWVDDEATGVEPSPAQQPAPAQPQPAVEQPAPAEGEEKGLLEQAGDFLTGDHSGLETALDTVKGVAIGATKGAKEIKEAVTPDFGIVESLEEFTGVPLSGVTITDRDEDDEFFSFLTHEENKQKLIREGLEVDGMNAVTPLGKFAQDTAQFMVGFIPAARGLKVAGLAGSTLKNLGNAAVAGGVADALAFDASKKTISEYIQTTPYANEVNQFLVADDNDSDAYKRMLRGIEGAGLGLVLDTAMIGIIKATKSAIKVTDKASDAVFNEGIIKTAKEVKAAEKVVEAAKGASKDKPNTKLESTLPSKFDQDPQKLAEAKFTLAKQEPVLSKAGVDSFIANVKSGKSPVDSGDTPIFNWARMSTDDGGNELNKAWNLMTDAMEKEKLGQGRATPDGVKSHSAEVLQAAQIMEKNAGMKTGDLISELQKRGMDADGMAAHIQAGSAMVLDIQRQVITTAKAVELGDTVAQRELGNLINIATEISKSVKDMQRGSARATAAGRISKKAGAPLDFTKLNLKNVDGTRIEDIGAVARRITSLSDSGELGTMLREVKGESLINRTIRGMNEYYINALLSNPSTQVVNIIGSSIRTLMQPVEKIVGGAIMGNGATVSEGGRQMLYLITSMRESLQFGVKAFKTYDNVVDPGKGTNEFISKNAISMEYKDYMKAGIAKNSQYAAAASINAIGHVVRFPSRMLLTMDEVIKQANYRATLKTNLDTEAAAMFKTTDDGVPIPRQEAEDMRDEYIKRKFAEGFDSDGVGTDANALADARAGTFTTPLDPERGVGTAVVSSISDQVNKMPILRQFVPFIRTPWNILSDVAQRSPGLNLLNSKFRKELMSSDPAIAAQARGKMAVGAALWGGAVMLATEGKITGAGPQDLKVRAMWVKQGWRPYSFVSENDDGSVTYTPYNRMDPIATFLAIAADFNEIASNQSIEDNEEIFAAVIMSLRDQLTSKTFIKSTMNVVNALTGREGQARTSIASHISGFAPGLLMTAGRTYDDWTGVDSEGRPNNVKRITKGGDILDRFRAKVPGYHEDLPAQIDFITGESVMVDQTPIGLVHSSNFMPQAVLKSDPVSKELMEQGVPFQEIARKENEYEFDNNELERLYQLTFQSGKGNMTLNEKLAELMETYDYQSAHSGEDLTGRITGTRKHMIQSVIQEAKREAKEALAEESQRYASYLNNVGQVDDLVNSGYTQEKSQGNVMYRDLIKSLK